MGDGISLAAIGRIPFAKRGALFAKLGMYFWEADIPVGVTSGSEPGNAKATADGTDVMFGLGGELYFPGFLNGRLGLRAEWERYKLDSTDVDLISASLLVRFGDRGR